MTTLDPTTTADTEVSPSRWTGTNATRVIGIATVGAMAWLLLFALGLSPADVNQGESVRLIYRPPPDDLGRLPFLHRDRSGLCVLPVHEEPLARLGSARWGLRRARRRLRRVDARRRCAVGPAHLGCVLAVGPAPHHHSAAVRHLHRVPRRAAARRLPPAASQALGGHRAPRRAADPARPLVGRIWRSLHQEATILDVDGDPDIDGTMLTTVFIGMIAFTLLYVWLVMHRTRTMAMEDLLEDRGLDIALAERRAEGGRTMIALDRGRRLHLRQLCAHVRRRRAGWSGVRCRSGRSSGNKSPTTRSTGPERRPSWPTWTSPRGATPMRSRRPPRRSATSAPSSCSSECWWPVA